MKVQLLGLVVVPFARKFSVRLVPGGIVFWLDCGVRVRVLPLMLNSAGQAHLTWSPDSTAVSCQPWIGLLPLLSIVNWPWKPFCH